MLVGPYATRGLGPSRASCKRLHNHLMEVMSWRNNSCRDLCCRGQGLSRANLQRLYHNHLMVVISWRNRNDVTFIHAPEQGYKRVMEIY